MDKILKNKTYFISGHRNITQEDFDKYYGEPLAHIESMYQFLTRIKEEDVCTPYYIMGDYEGCDIMAQRFLIETLKVDPQRIKVYHMGEKPMNLFSNKVKLVGGFATDNERDEAMTFDSDEDIAFIYDETKWSGTGQNILRRYKMFK